MNGKKAPTGPEGAVVTSWRGYTRYGCTACQFDTLSPEQFADHWRQAHTPLETHEAPAPAFETAPAPVGETRAED